jgi:hypothetical protein
MTGCKSGTGSTSQLESNISESNSVSAGHIRTWNRPSDSTAEITEKVETPAFSAS